jgi:hypothetical protein
VPRKPGRRRTPEGDLFRECLEAELAATLERLDRSWLDGPGARRLIDASVVAIGKRLDGAGLDPRLRNLGRDTLGAACGFSVLGRHDLAADLLDAVRKLLAPSP